MTHIRNGAGERIGSDCGDMAKGFGLATAKRGRARV
jgi:hypothetical protein